MSGPSWNRCWRRVSQFMPHMPGLLQRPLGQTGISADLEPPPACAAKVECSCARCF